MYSHNNDLWQDVDPAFFLGLGLALTVLILDFQSLAVVLISVYASQGWRLDREAMLTTCTGNSPRRHNSTLINNHELTMLPSVHVD